MITFQCIEESVNWRVERNERLVCYYATRETAWAAVDGFVRHCEATGKQACTLPPKHKTPFIPNKRAPAPTPTDNTFASEILALRPRLVRTAMYLTKRPYDAEDLVQDTIARALINSDKFERGSNLPAWLNRMMRNLFYTRCRSDAREIVTGHIDDVRTQSASQEWSALTHDVQDFMATKIPAGQRDALCLVSHGSSYSEIAQQIGCKEGTVKSRVSRARCALQHEFGQL